MKDIKNIVPLQYQYINTNRIREVILKSESQILSSDCVYEYFFSKHFD